MQKGNEHRLGEWALEERIGVGGVADVWRATAPDGRRAALKVLREQDRSAAHRSRFLREGRLLQRLACPGLPVCYDIHDGPQPYLALELLEGDTLSERIRARGPLPVELLDRVASVLLRLLSSLHNKGIVHRDIKASNMFLCDDGRILLLDLGLAADPSDPLITTLGDVMGTYAYMAPEQIAGAEIDFRCDLYSLGVTLYEAAAGVRPFFAQDANGYLRAHREGRAPPLSERRPGAPHRLVDTIMRLMARDPAARPATASIALAMLSGTANARRSLGRAPLVGRAAALGALQGVRDGGGAVAVLGEVGAGTRRLANQALLVARAGGHETIAIRCNRRAAPDDPYFQFARNLSQILATPVDPSPRALQRALADLAAEGPLFVLVEDVDQCDAETIEGLNVILAPTRGLSVLYTAQEATPGMAVHLVHLRPLTLDEVEALISGMLGTRTAPSGLPEQIHRISAGLPAVVVLALRELVSRGALTCEGLAETGEPNWYLDRAAPIMPTVGLARLFGEVLVRLPDAALRVLEVLAISGDPLPVRVALEVAGEDSDTIGQLLMEALVVLDRHSDMEWVALRRPAVGALVLAQTHEGRQLELHQRIAWAMKRLPREAWREDRIAWHTAHGARPEQAAEALLDLGEVLLDRGQVTRAVEVLSRAAQQPCPEPRVSAAIAIARGEALAVAGRVHEAANALQAGWELARNAGEDQLGARALVALSELHGFRDPGGALALAEQAMALLTRLPGDPLIPRALLASANAYRIGAEPRLATARYEQCIDEGLALGQREYAAMAHGGLGLVLAEDGRLEDADRHLEYEAAFLRTRTMPARLSQTLSRLAHIRLRLGDVNGALQSLDEGDAVARVAELSYERALLQVVRASLHLELGDRRQASALLRQSTVALESDAPVFLRLSWRRVQAEHRMLVGDHQAALAAFQAAEMEAGASGYTAIQAYCLGMVGVLTAETDALTRAMEVLVRAGDRSLTARLLLHGGRIGGDADILHSACQEGRASRDRFVLLAVLHAVGSDEARREAASVARVIEGRTPKTLLGFFYKLPPVIWCGVGAERLSSVG